MANLQIAHGEAIEFLSASGQVAFTLAVDAGGDLMLNPTSSGGHIFVNADPVSKNGGLKIDANGKVYPSGLILAVDSAGDVPFTGNDGNPRKLAATS